MMITPTATPEPEKKLAAAPPHATSPAATDKAASVFEDHARSFQTETDRA